MNNSWEAVYRSMHELFVNFSKKKNVSESDLFFLIDDDWGGRHQKVEILSDDFWTLELEAKIQELLLRKFDNWGLVVIHPNNKRKKPFIVYSDGIDTDFRWD
jgi:hypothetical protein